MNARPKTLQSKSAAIVSNIKSDHAIQSNNIYKSSMDNVHKSSEKRKVQESQKSVFFGQKSALENNITPIAGYS
jgi:hypothetical protein